MADLPLGAALTLANSLVTIGHPWHDGALHATAMDLVKWCKGGIINGRPTSAEQQAAALIDEARTQWDKWPERGGTKCLLELFRLKFAPDKRPAPTVTEGDLVARGLLAAPCPHCPADASHCEYGGEKAHARYKAETDHAEPAPTRARSSSVPKVEPIEPEELQAAIANEQEEIRRRKAAEPKEVRAS